MNQMSTLVAKKEQEAKQAQNNLSKMIIAKFVAWKGLALKEKQDDIEKLIPVLTLRSLTAFDVKHKTSISSALLETQKAGLKSKIFLPGDARR